MFTPGLIGRFDHLPRAPVCSPKQSIPPSETGARAAKLRNQASRVDHGWRVKIGLRAADPYVLLNQESDHILQLQQTKTGDSAVKEGIHSIQVGIQSWAIDNGDVFSPVSEVRPDGSVAMQVDNLPLNPYTGQPIASGSRRGATPTRWAPTAPRSSCPATCRPATSRCPERPPRRLRRRAPIRHGSAGGR